MHDLPGTCPSPSITADGLGEQLAGSVRTRAQTSPEGLAEFVKAMNFETDRVRTELAYLSIVTMHFCISAGLPDREQHARVLGAFYRELWAGLPWQANERGLKTRTAHYETALNNPHPDLGRGYGMGRAFARLCGASHDVAVIEFGALAYVEQLPPILGLLRGVTVV